MNSKLKKKAFDLRCCLLNAKAEYESRGFNPAVRALTLMGEEFVAPKEGDPRFERYMLGVEHLGKINLAIESVIFIEDLAELID